MRVRHMTTLTLKMTTSTKFCSVCKIPLDPTKNHQSWEGCLSVNKRRPRHSSLQSRETGFFAIVIQFTHAPYTPPSTILQTSFKQKTRDSLLSSWSLKYCVIWSFVDNRSNLTNSAHGEDCQKPVCGAQTNNLLALGKRKNNLR